MSTIALSFAELTEFWRLPVHQRTDLIRKCIEEFAQEVVPLDEASAQVLLREDYGNRLSRNGITTVQATIVFMHKATAQYRLRERAAFELLRLHLHNRSEAIAVLQRYSETQVESDHDLRFSVASPTGRDNVDAHSML